VLPEPDDAAPMQFVAALATSRAYGPDTQYLALPNYVQVGSSSSGGRLFISHPDEDLRFDQTFPLATLVARARAGAVTRAVAELSFRQVVCGAASWWAGP
jgi:hypothetical protein